MIGMYSMGFRLAVLGIGLLILVFSMKINSLYAARAECESYYNKKIEEENTRAYFSGCMDQAIMSCSNPGYPEESEGCVQVASVICKDIAKSRTKN